MALGVDTLLDWALNWVASSGKEVIHECIYQQNALLEFQQLLVPSIDLHTMSAYAFLSSLIIGVFVSLGVAFLGLRLILGGDGVRARLAMRNLLMIGLAVLAASMAYIPLVNLSSTVSSTILETTSLAGYSDCSNSGILAYQPAKIDFGKIAKRIGGAPSMQDKRIDANNSISLSWFSGIASFLLNSGALEEVSKSTNVGEDYASEKHLMLAYDAGLLFANLTLSFRIILLFAGFLVFPIGVALYLTPFGKDYGRSLSRLTLLVAFLSVLDAIIILAGLEALKQVDSNYIRMGIFYLTGFANIAVLWSAAGVMRHGFSGIIHRRVYITQGRG